ncbi:MAG TPA: hypothetical protein VFI97_07330, partial [Arthrobacter sp.]|nr:hypothetical protein [Arthrobacter sp.]
EEPNLNALCTRDHALKTAKMWAHTQHRNGKVDWTSPAGRKYTTTPDGPLPEMRPVPDITHLTDLAKNQTKTTTAQTGAVPEEKNSAVDSKGKDRSKGGADNNQSHATTTQNEPDDSPPF